MEHITYEEFIQNILETRGRFACGNEYHERHHILPRCMQGINDEENLIDLFAREHFIAHKLLAEENPDNDGLVYAWWMMSHVKGDNQNRYELTAEEYEEARIMFSNMKIGTRRTEETKRKISESRKGIILSEETKRKIGNAAKNISEETRIKISKSQRGRKHSEETKQKMREKAIERLKNPKNHPCYGTGRHIIQLSKQKEYISEYISAEEAWKITGVSCSAIYNCCNHKPHCKTAGGYIWLYKDEYEKLGDINEV